MGTELIINKAPFIRVYPQYAFLDAIINTGNTNADKLCSIIVRNNDQYKWNYTEMNAQLDISRDTLEVYRRGCGVHTAGQLYCEVEEFQEFTFCIPYMQYTNVWDSVTFFLKADEGTIEYEFNIFCCGDWCLDVNGKNAFFQSNRQESEVPTWFKVQKNAGTIHMYCSFDSTEWLKVTDIVLPNVQTKKYRIGFDVHLCENQYHKWLCNNFIQIRFDNNCDKAMEYVGFINREWKNYTVHPLVKFSYDKEKIIRKRGLWNYIVENICNDRYMEIWLDEYYIEGLSAYQQFSFMHESLIYGFDIENQKVKLMSLKNGKPVLIETSADMLELAWENASGNNYTIQTFEYEPDRGGYSIELDSIIRGLRSYLQGENLMQSFKHLAQAEEGVFGIKIYEEILGSPQNKELFIDDVRIVYLIKEHKECMRHRIQYLYEYGVFGEEAYLKLVDLMKSIVNNATLMLHLVMKYRLIPVEKRLDSIWNCMKELPKLEEKCYQMLIDELEKYNHK